MSENRDTETQHSTQEEGEENLEGLSSEGIASSSSFSDKLPMTLPGENFELGESSQGRATTTETPANLLLTEPTEVGDNMGFFLFEICLYQKDAELDRLLIPVELALDHFPSLAYDQRDYEETIQITNPCNTSELATVKYDRKEIAFAIGSTWWPRIASLNKLGAKDTVRFYRPLHPERDRHYLVDCVKFVSQEIVSHPEFMPENFLFQLELDQVAIIVKSLIVPMEEARKHFSALGIPAETHHTERLYLTNAENEEWRVKISASGRIHTLYMIVLEKDFLDQNNLEDGDVIKFYKPVGSSKPRHFLFEVEKGGAAAGDDPASPEIVRGGENLEGLSSEGIASSSSCSDMPMMQPGKNFELGESSQGRASTSEILANPLLTDPTKVGDNEGFFLFEIGLYQKDAELDRLLIPVELALNHFPSLAYRQRDYEETILITNPCNTSELATVKYDRKEIAFVIGSTWWPRIACLNKLEAKDTVRFYRPLHPERDQHYLVDCVKFISPEIVSLPEFMPENFLFQLELHQVAIIVKSLIVPMEEARKHFSALGIPAETHHVERLYFTNAQNEEWRVKISASGRIQTLYTIVLEEDFLDQNNLEDGDLIKFYKPIGPSKPRHFLFEVVKGGEAAWDDPAPPEIEESGGGTAAGDDSAPTEIEESDDSAPTEIEESGGTATGDDPAPTEIEESGGGTAAGDDSAPTEIEESGGGTAPGDDPAPTEIEESGGGAAAGDDPALPETEESGGGRRRGRKWRKFNFGGCFMALKNKGRKELP